MQESKQAMKAPEEVDKEQKRRWLIYFATIEAYARTLPGVDNGAVWEVECIYINDYSIFARELRRILRLDTISPHARIPRANYELQCDALKLIGKLL